MLVIDMTHREFKTEKVFDEMIAPYPRFACLLVTEGQKQQIKEFLAGTTYYVAKENFVHPVMEYEDTKPFFIVTATDLELQQGV